MTSQQIRQQFLDFFASKGHAFVPSSPVVPHDDPTLMFTNAGMNQFKPIFLGAARPDHPRVANSQKCIRAGGKHNDLDDVGQDTYHHTFFEMLGNWSFGDYFKKEAIEWAWELLTKVWRIDKSRLHATYFGGSNPSRDREGAGELPIANFQSPIEGGTSSTIGNRQSAIGNSGEWELDPDYEARDLWLSVMDIDPSHVHPGSMKDNFWEMGETGPCGPCSEIHIDLTPDKSGAALVNKGDARVIELWNLVFIQFNRAGDRTLTPLPAKHVDTGMGFERLCAVLQGMQAGRIGQFSNYDTDVFGPIFEAIQRRTGAPAYQGTLPGDEATERRSDGVSQSTIMVDVSYRVIADHLRCLVFALTDGAIPSNEGRGYVLRRILRRAVRYGRQCLNMHEPFLCDLVPTVVEHMAGIFPELRSAHGGKNVQHVIELIRDEEASFMKTLDRGIRLFEEAICQSFHYLVDDYLIRRTKSRFETPYATQDGAIHWIEIKYPDLPEGAIVDLPSSIDVEEVGPDVWLLDDGARVEKLGTMSISGETAFRLHDTYGFPIDLTQLMASERGLRVELAEYQRLMEEARGRARSGKVIELKLSDTIRVRSDVTATATVTPPPTDDAPKYAVLSLGTRCRGWIKLDQDAFDLLDSRLENRVDSGLITEQTCFYAAQGGQIGDRGQIICETGTFDVSDTQKVGGIVVHVGRVSSGYFDPPQDVTLSVDQTRIPTMKNHTSTHILNWALRKVLGEHVEQKGSLVDPEKTRFDFSHNKALSRDELAKIEHHVKSQISSALPVLTNPEVEQKKAREVNTLRAVFGEKYPDRVRVVSIGADIDAMLRDPKNPKWMQYSVEFCGGTHLKNSREAEEFVLVHEEAVAKGVRRLVGLTGEKAKEARQRGEFFLEVSGELRSEVQSSKFKVQKGAGPHGGPYDLTRLLRELSEATIPVLTRHRLAEQIAVLQESAKEHEKKAAATAQRGAVEAVGDLLAAHAIDVNGVTVVVGEVPGGNADALRSGIDYVRNKRGSSAVLLATVENGKVTLVAGMSRDVVDRGVKAGDLVKEICPLVGGRGGGRPDMAQGGGNDPKGLPKALDRARGWLGEKLS